MHGVIRYIANKYCFSGNLALARLVAFYSLTNDNRVKCS